VRHPHDELLRKTLKKGRVASLYARDGGFTVFTLEAWCYLSSKLVSKFLHNKERMNTFELSNRIHQTIQTSTSFSHLHTITNTQNRHLPLPNDIPNSFSHMRSTIVIDTIRPTTQNHRRQFMLAKFFGGDETGVEFTVDVKFTDATGDKMGVLGSKI
jgi:hypothetical protein